MAHLDVGGVQGAAKKIGGPRSGWVGQRPRKDQGQGRIYFLIFLYGVLNSPRRETPKNTIQKKSGKIGFGFFSIFL
jgi:hypothetical protein